ncbi:MAG TPA: polysaccharide deacetylase family protein [Candidatus Acidoferrum sp.]|nr:polysaccharide deacetylase family protein [Candidatus Acidoferrum sp.]
MPTATPSSNSMAPAQSGNANVIGAPPPRQRGWKDLAVQGLFRTGAVRLLGKLGSSYELNRATPRSLPLLRRPRTSRLAVLCYHRIGLGGIPFYSQLAAAEFEAQMRFLRKHHRVISLDQLVLEMESPTTLEPAVAVTFDDGYQGLFSEAFPILQAYRIPATVFLISGAIESGEVCWYDRVFLALLAAPYDSIELEMDRVRRFALRSPDSRMRAAVSIITFLRTLDTVRRKAVCSRLESKVKLPEQELHGRMLNWEQIRVMKRGGIDFGAHTVSHPIVSRLTSVELQHELRESKRVIEERMDTPVHHFAFPFGKLEECGESAKAVLRSTGYRSASTTVWGLNTQGTHPYNLKRVQIGELGSLARFAFELNRLFLLGTNQEDSAPVPSVAFANGNPEFVAKQRDWEKQDA